MEYPSSSTDRPPQKGKCSHPTEAPGRGVRAHRLTFNSSSVSLYSSTNTPRAPATGGNPTIPVVFFTVATAAQRSTREANIVGVHCGGGSVRRGRGGAGGGAGGVLTLGVYCPSM